jgi:hypothetical protein
MFSVPLNCCHTMSLESVNIIHLLLLMLCQRACIVKCSLISFYNICDGTVSAPASDAENHAMRQRGMLYLTIVSGK